MIAVPPYDAIHVTQYRAGLERAQERRLEHNITPWHVDSHGTEIELLGAAGELAARILYGQRLELHTGFDGGMDFVWKGYRVDVKSTYLKNYPSGALQWPERKPIKCDIALMMAVQIETLVVWPVGWAFRDEILAAPVDRSREIPCYSIKFSRLRKIEVTFQPWFQSRNARLAKPRSTRQ